MDIIITLAFIDLIAVLMLVLSSARTKIRGSIGGLDAVAIRLSVLIAITAFVLFVLFLIFAKPAATVDKDYRLESFTEFDNGYEYSYYDEKGNLIGGFLDKDLVEFGFYDDEPFLTISTYSGRKYFWFFYTNRGLSSIKYIFHVMRKK